MIQRCLVLVLVALFCTLGVTCIKPTKFIKFNGQDFYVHGINVPWFNGQYGHDIGPNEVTKYGVWYNSAQVDKWFADIASMGFNVMRIWLCEGLEGYKFDSNMYITGLDPTFMAHVEDVVNLAKKHNLHIYFTISDQFFKTQAKNPMTDKNALQAYLNNVVDPIVTKFKGNPTIFAFDLTNEIESSIAGNNGNWGNEGCTWDNARSFMSECVKRIKSIDPSRLVSSGSGWHDSQNVKNGLFSGLGFDFYDYHSYNSNGSLAAADSIRTDLPVIIGECGPTITTRNDQVEKDVDLNYMNHNIRSNYAGGLIWSFGEPSDTDVFSFINADGSHRPVVQALTDFNKQIE